MNMEKIYYCVRGCHVTDINKGRCPRCDDWLVQVDKREMEKIQGEIDQMQREAAQTYVRTGRTKEFKLY